MNGAVARARMAADVTDVASMTGTVARSGVARNAALLALATIAARVCTFGLAITLGRGLGATDYGRYGFAAAVVTVIAPLADLGLTPYVIREVARRGADAPSLTRRCLRAKLFTSALTFAALSAVAFMLESDGGLRFALVALCAGSLLDGVSQFVYGWFQGAERMAYEAAATTAAAFTRSVGGVVLVLAGAQLEGVVAWIAGVSALQAAWAAGQLRRSLSAPSEQRVDDDVAWRSVVAMGLVTLFTMVYLRADSVMLGWLRGERPVGWYTSAYTVTGTLQILPWMLAVALSPVFARTYRRDATAFRVAWNEGVRIVTVIAVPLALLASLLAGPVLRLLYGSQFAPGAAALEILAWSTPVWAWNMIVAGALRGARREHLLTSVTAAGALLNVGLNLWAIPRFGLRGAAAVTVATEALVLAILAAAAIGAKVVGMPQLPVGRLLTALGILAAVTVLLRDAAWLLAAVVGASAYLAVLTATRVIGPADLRRIRQAMVRA